MVDGREGGDGATAVERLLVELARWAADERATDAARSRTRERWLRQQSAEGARMAGVALDLAERRGPGVVLKAGGGGEPGGLPPPGGGLLVGGARARPPRPLPRGGGGGRRGGAGGGR